MGERNAGQTISVKTNHLFLGLGGICLAALLLFLFNSNASLMEDTREIRSLLASSGELELCKVELHRATLEGRGLDEKPSKSCEPELSQCKADLRQAKAQGCTPPTSSSTMDGVSGKPVGELSPDDLRKEVEDLREQNRRLIRENSKLANELGSSGSNAESKISSQAMEEARKLLADCGSSTSLSTVSGDMDVWKGYTCKATDEQLKRYMDYKPREMCPNDWYFVQKLIYKFDCFALPRRRCLSLTPQNPTEPEPFPRSLFSQTALKDSNLRWDLHQCKSFECLTTRPVGDCRNCFNLTLEARRWHTQFHGSPTIKEVLALKPGGIRIGLDAGGGTGSFAAHMALHNITILTTAMNIETVSGRRAGLPYMEVIAMRGLVPLHVPHSARLPFYDGTLDIVHSMNTIKYFPPMAFEELLFEWDRVLRAGGIMWFETFYAPVGEMPVYLQIIDMLGYNKLYWKFTPKVDAGEREGEHIYLNAVIEKPVRTGGEKLEGPPKIDMKDMGN